MGVPSSAGPDLGRTPHRRLRSTFIAMVVAPAVCLTVLWLAAVSLTLAGLLDGHRLASLSHSQLAEVALVAVAGALVVAVTLVLAGSFARRVARDLSGLTVAARRLAAGQQVQADAADSKPGTAAAGTVSQRGTRTTEIAEATGAIAGLQQAAAAAAAGEAGLRDGLRQVIVSLARRNQSLLQRQLRLIDALEQKAADPAALADLFALDHLTTRMRRHAESLAILAGAAPGRSWREPVPVIDVIRGAMAEVEDYQRVAVVTRAEDAISGSAAADMIHLLAELIENATLFSPSGTPVEVRAGRVANGFAIEVDDRGLGIEPGQLAEINRQLDDPPDFDLANSDRLGLFVGGKLAARYGVRVSLRPSPYGGTTAIVLLPASIVVPVGGAGIALQPATEHPAISAAPGGRPGEPLALVGPRPVPPGPRTTAPPVVTAPASSASPASAGQPVLPAQPVPPAPLPPAVSSPAGGAPPAGSPGPSAAPAIPSVWSVPPGRSVFSPAETPSTRPGPAPDPAPSAPAARSALPARSSAPAKASAPAPAAGTPDSGTYRGLPRRTRQASLSPHLRDSAAAAGRSSASGPLPAPVDERAPEEARNLAASLQSGWQRGRAADLPEAGSSPAAGSDQAGRDPASAPGKEK
ncbi:MAG TPA: ATP-binding protein [Streptosporangiaceae bacterium]|nr:ATP-binding protein [Streptosporangiaceae bacterium]